MSKYFQISRSFLEVNGNLFEVIKETSEDKDPEELKKMLGADIVFRREGRYYFSKLIPEAELAEESAEENNAIATPQVTEREIENLISQTLKEVKTDLENWQEVAANKIVETLKRLYE